MARLIELCLKEDPGKRPRFDLQILQILDKMREKAAALAINLVGTVGSGGLSAANSTLMSRLPTYLQSGPGHDSSQGLVSPIPPGPVGITLQ
ncbi:unnamed protein product [Protopolystoma xenopodis]|uniref:Uncharacterized protein n=1 Tax=Protopolystoma xenopodis TaxID=117903 RepID=A0A3S5BM78_9PLAT|nr:unnamed protein product [Protopolystoma xenopodis]